MQGCIKAQDVPLLYMSLKICTKCNILQKITQFGKSSKTKDCLRSQCKACRKIEGQGRYARNRDKILANNTRWQKENRIKASINTKRCIERHPYSVEQKKHRAQLVKAWNDRHPEFERNRSVIKRLRKLERTINKSLLPEIYAFYKNCPKGYEVDHIIPLSNKLISGLHVPNNLQYLPIKENAFKTNRFDGTYNNQTWKQKLYVC